MMFCLNCNSLLEKKIINYGMQFECPSCDGVLVSYYALNKSNVSSDFLYEKIKNARKDITVSGNNCPSCNHDMSLQTDTVSKESIFICRSCSMIWTREQTLALLPQQIIPDTNASETDSRADTRIKMTDEQSLAIINAMRVDQGKVDQIIHGTTDNNPKKPIHYFAGLLGVPVEEDSSFFEFYPLITWAMIGFFLVIYIITRVDLRQNLLMLGFIPDQWNRAFGIPILTSFTMHINFMHFFSNSYFLLIFGDNVENEIGRYFYLLLMFFSHLCGVFFHSLLDPNSSIPLVGASAGISGVMTFYCIVFPKNKLSWVLRIFWKFFVIKFKAWVFLLIWLILQIIIIKSQIAGNSSVSALGHMGGVFVGIVFATIYKRKEWFRKKLRQ